MKQKKDQNRDATQKSGANTQDQENGRPGNKENQIGDQPNVVEKEVVKRLVERPPISLALDKKTWLLYVDGSSGKEGSGINYRTEQKEPGAGILLVDPEGGEWQYGLALEFPAGHSRSKH